MVNYQQYCEPRFTGCEREGMGEQSTEKQRRRRDKIEMIMMFGSSKLLECLPTFRENESDLQAW